MDVTKAGCGERLEGKKTTNNAGQYTYITQFGSWVYINVDS